MVLLNRISCIHKQFLISPKETPLPTKKSILLLNISNIMLKWDVKLRKRLRKKLSNSLSSEALSKVYSSFDLLGGIAIIKAPSNLDDAKIVAKQIMSIHKGVKTVFSQSSPIRGDYRTRQLIQGSWLRFFCRFGKMLFFAKTFSWKVAYRNTSFSPWSCCQHVFGCRLL